VLTSRQKKMDADIYFFGRRASCWPDLATAADDGSQFGMHGGDAADWCRGSLVGGVGLGCPVMVLTCSRMVPGRRNEGATGGRSSVWARAAARCCRLRGCAWRGSSRGAGLGCLL
jgi:hypothetical protein